MALRFSETIRKVVLTSRMSFENAVWTVFVFYAALGVYLSVIEF